MGFLKNLFKDRRDEAFREMGKHYGMSFDRVGGYVGGTNNFDLFKKGSGRQFLYRLNGHNAKGTKVTLFDYQYYTESTSYDDDGYEETDTTYHNQTLLLAESPNFSFIPFRIRPEGFFHKIGAAFGMQDIDFPSNPKFSKRYMVRGEVEGAVRGQISPQLMDLLAENKGWVVEGTQKYLLIHRNEKRIHRKELDEFYEFGLRIMDCFGA